MIEINADPGCPTRVAIGTDRPLATAKMRDLGRPAARPRRSDPPDAAVAFQLRKRVTPAEIAERKVMAPIRLARFDLKATPELFPPEAAADGAPVEGGVVHIPIRLNLKPDVK